MSHNLANNNNRAMGFRPTPEELAELIEEIDEDGSGAIEFPEFAQLCAKFLVEDPDPETMRAELKQAFRLFDKEGRVSRPRGPGGGASRSSYSAYKKDIGRSVRSTKIKTLWTQRRSFYIVKMPKFPKNQGFI